MEPLRIAVVLPHLGVYGGIRRFLELGSVWSGRGHDVALLLPSARAAERPWLPFPGSVGELAELRTRGPWDVVISPDPDLFLEAAPGPLRVFYAVLEGAPRARDAWRRADLVLANSAGMLRYLRRQGVAAVGAAGGVNAGFFTPPDPDPRDDRARGGPIRLLVYGRLSRKRKGTAVAVDAIGRACRAAGVEAALTMFDAPPPGAAEPALDPPRGIFLRWEVHPTQEKLRDLYRSADLFVSAERRAGWCNTAAEAMACGAAVVCTRSGTEDFAVDGETAAVSRWPWSWALAGRIRPLLTDPERRNRIARNGLRRIQEFSWDRTAERIEVALRASLTARRNRA